MLDGIVAGEEGPPGRPPEGQAQALEMENIHKRFPGVYALKGVSLEVARGEVLGLVGENGAGKSTLIKILSGAYDKDEGVIRLGGQEVEGADPHKMIELGVAVIYQEMELAPHLTVAENVFLGRPPKTRLGVVDWRKQERDARKLLEPLGVEIDPRSPIGSLSVAQRQMVEIARALSRNARIIVLDEPSAVLGDNELEGLFRVIERLKEDGVSFVYISHRLNEVFRLCDRVTVIKDGGLVGSDDTGNLNSDRLVAMMVGRELSDIYPDRTPRPGEEVLKVTGLSQEGVLHDASLTVRAGEIVGIAGLVGAGRTELLRAILGADPIDSGQVEVFGRRVRLRTPSDAIALRIGLLPEDRKTEGLFLNQTIRFNVTIARLKEVMSGGLLRPSLERKRVSDYVDRLRVRTPGIDTLIRNLSGGNQQKCVLSKWLSARCRILLVDEPTRGVDVGAKQEIYQLLADLADDGAAIVMVSSELPEILGMSDRIYVMREGRIVVELDRSEASEERIMRHATRRAEDAA